MNRATASTLAFVALVAGSCGGDDAKQTSAVTGASSALVGLFRVAPGACAEKTSGSYFRMVQPGGSVTAGPYVINGDSSCADKTWTLLRPGVDGGLRTGAFQPQPTPPFDTDGNATGGRIAHPQKWFAVAFGLATNEKDPQTGSATTAPALAADGSKLAGDLSALAAAWNGQHFNQGAPKPGGARPGSTIGPTGTYDATTRAYTLDWSSQIVGGPFNNFVGVWHLEGIFQPG